MCAYSSGRGLHESFGQLAVLKGIDTSRAARDHGGDRCGVPAWLAPAGVRRRHWRHLPRSSALVLDGATQTTEKPSGRAARPVKARKAMA